MFPILVTVEWLSPFANSPLLSLNPVLLSYPFSPPSFDEESVGILPSLAGEKEAGQGDPRPLVAALSPEKGDRGPHFSLATGVAGTGPERVTHNITEN